MDNVAEIERLRERAAEHMIIYAERVDVAEAAETTGSNGSYWTANSSIRSGPEERPI
jgi:hypothetical protein